jgi:hypothetical protein
MVSLGQVETLQIMLGNLLHGQWFYCGCFFEWNRRKVMTSPRWNYLDRVALHHPTNWRSVVYANGCSLLFQPQPPEMSGPDGVVDR